MGWHNPQSRNARHGRVEHHLRQGRLAPPRRGQRRLPYVRADISTNVSQFEGTYEVTTDHCRFAAAMDFSRATLKLTGGRIYGVSSSRLTHKVGTLTGNGTLGADTWQVSRYVATATPIVIEGTLRLASTTLDVSALCKKKLPDDAQLQLFTLSGGTITTTGTLTILPETPKAGYEWDTSTLKKDGILRIKETADGIEEIVNSKSSNSQCFDLQGRKVERPTHGIYIIGGKKVMIK